MKIEDYIKEVKAKLACNMSEENQKKFVCYEYSNEQVDNNIDYFKECCDDNLSVYTALLLFQSYLDDNKQDE